MADEMNAGAKDPGLTRRGFLAAAGVAGGALAMSQMKVLAESPASAPVLAPATQADSYAMLPFGKTGLKVSVVGFGAIKISPPVGQRLLKMAIDSGVNLVHTARGYTGGKSVASIGAFLKEAPEYRKKIVLCLKENPRVSEEALDRDLKNLCTDYVDVYLPQLQKPDQAAMEDAIAALENLKKKGKIRFGGFTCHEDMLGVCQLVLDKAPKGYDATLLATKPIRPHSGKAPVDESAKRFVSYLKQLKANGVGIISMKSGATEAVGLGASEYGSHMRVLTNAGVDTCITSFASVKEIENAQAAGLHDLRLTSRDEQAWQRQWQSAIWPCLMCGTCTGACPAGLPVADLMRMTMYRDHYHMARHARQEFAGLGIDAAAAMQSCDDCTTCSGVCPVGLASGRRVQDIITALA